MSTHGYGTPSCVSRYQEVRELDTASHHWAGRLWSSVGGARKTDAGWQVRCNRGIIVGFILGQGNSSREYVLDPEDLNWRQGGSDGDWCLGGIQANDRVSSGDWLLGDTFLRVSNTIYRCHSVLNGLHLDCRTSTRFITLLSMVNPLR